MKRPKAKVEAETKVINGLVFEHYSSALWNASDSKLSYFNLSTSDWCITPSGSGFVYEFRKSTRYGGRAAIWYLEPGQPSYYWTGGVVDQWQPELFA